MTTNTTSHGISLDTLTRAALAAADGEPAYTARQHKKRNELMWRVHKAIRPQVEALGIEHEWLVRVRPGEDGERYARRLARHVAGMAGLVDTSPDAALMASVEWLLQHGARS